MLLFEDALALTLSKAKVIGPEMISLSESLNRVLAEDVTADLNMPPFDKSAMDGYACRKADLSSAMEVIEVIQAGQFPSKVVGNGQCAQIMTGAMVPEGADVVIMVEETQINDSGKISYTGKAHRPNICYLGEDLKKGDVVLKAGTLINARHIPILASVGCAEVPVYRQPRIGIVATGSELVEPNQKPGPSQMIAQLQAIGFYPTYFGIAIDDEELTYRLLESALSKTDVLLLSGGVSMGEYDFVPAVLEKLNLSIQYQKLAVKPGKPTTFAVNETQAVFALPGNPVSSFIQLELLVKPYLYQVMGCHWQPAEWVLPAGEAFKRKKADRKAWIPVMISSKGQVRSLDYHGSAHIFALNKAQGFIHFDIGKYSIEEGELVHVRPI